MSQSYWRNRAAAVIYEVLREMPPDSTIEQKRAALKKAYPFGERRMHPYYTHTKLNPKCSRTPTQTPKLSNYRKTTTHYQ
jgi:hypothetical protein